MFDDPTATHRDFRAVWSGMRASGVDLGAVEAALELPVPVDDAAPGQIDKRDVGLAWSAALAQTGDPTLPLKVGAAVPFGAYDVIDYLGAASATVGEGLRQLSRYFRLITPDLQLHLEPGFRARFKSCSPHARGLFELYTVGITLTRFREASGAPIPLERLSLVADEPPSRWLPAVDRFAAGPVEWGAPHTVAQLAGADWNRPLAGREAGLSAVLERHAAECVAKRGLEDDPLSQIRKGLRDLLAEGDPRLEPVAARLALSTRTLQRRLKAAGTSFQALVEEERRDAACAYLRGKGLGVGEVAYLVGYSDASAFIRAFKRWTGRTPLEYRDG